MLETRFTELIGCAVPIQQAGMGPHANPGLAAAVANAGGLGTVSVYGSTGGPPAHVARKLERTRERTAGAFGANFILRFMEPELVHETVNAAALVADVVEFFYSDPDPVLVGLVHEGGALACWQVGSRDEALAAVDAGCDFIVAQSIAAGGHVRGTVGLLALLDQVLEAVEVPVLAAGGIGSGRALAAVLAAGADGARVGTRFLAVREAEAHPDYLQALIAAEAQDTVYTEAFSNGWPDAPHRLLRASLEAAQAFEGPVVGSVGATWDGERREVLPFSPWGVHKSAEGHIAAMSMWAGESVGGLTGVQTAVEIIDELVGEAEALLGRWP
ncbi:MAG: nitronate monooxygenase [Candidatus Promineifilaceae bacterium]|nr:nitronate monooxygenase [Candidatus Promineifilaceae bacterium]